MANKTVETIEDGASKGWSWFRVWEKEHPLSGFWGGVALGTIIIAPALYGLGRLFRVI